MAGGGEGGKKKGCTYLQGAPTYRSYASTAGRDFFLAPPPLPWTYLCPSRLDASQTLSLPLSGMVQCLGMDAHPSLGPEDPDLLPPGVPAPQRRAPGGLPRPLFLSLDIPWLGSKAAAPVIIQPLPHTSKNAARAVQGQFPTHGYLPLRVPTSLGTCPMGLGT